MKKPAEHFELLHDIVSRRVWLWSVKSSRMQGRHTRKGGSKDSVSGLTICVLFLLELGTGPLSPPNPASLQWHAQRDAFSEGNVAAHSETYWRNEWLFTLVNQSVRRSSQVMSFSATHACSLYNAVLISQMNMSETELEYSFFFYLSLNLLLGSPVTRS